MEEPAHGPQVVQLPLAVVSGGLGTGEEVTDGSTFFGQHLQFGPWLGGLASDRATQAVGGRPSSAIPCQEMPPYLDFRGETFQPVPSCTTPSQPVP